MFNPKHEKEITKRRDWGRKQCKYKNKKGQYRTILGNYKNEQIEDFEDPEQVTGSPEQGQADPGAGYESGSDIS